MKKIKLNVRTDDKNKIVYERKFTVLDVYDTKKYTENWFNGCFEYDYQDVIEVNPVYIPVEFNRIDDIDLYNYFEIVTIDDDDEKLHYYVAAPCVYEVTFKNYNSNADIFLHEPFEEQPDIISVIKSDLIDIPDDEKIDFVMMDLPQMPEDLYDDLELSLQMFFGL